MTIARLIEGRGAIVSCDVSTPVREAAALLAEKRIGALPVVDGDELAGIFSERDVIYRLREFGPSVLAMPVGQVMTAPAVTVTPETPVMIALSLMTRRRIRHLPVVEARDNSVPSAERMIAFVSIGDLVKYRIDKVESEAEALRSYIQAG